MRRNRTKFFNPFQLELDFEHGHAPSTAIHCAGHSRTTEENPGMMMAMLQKIFNFFAVAE